MDDDDGKDDDKDVDKDNNNDSAQAGTVEAGHWRMKGRPVALSRLAALTQADCVLQLAF